MARLLNVLFLKAQSVISFRTKSWCHNCVTKTSKMYLFTFCYWHRVVFYVVNHVLIAFRLVIHLSSGWLCVCMCVCSLLCWHICKHNTLTVALHVCIAFAGAELLISGQPFAAIHAWVQEFEDMPGMSVSCQSVMAAFKIPLVHLLVTIGFATRQEKLLLPVGVGQHCSSQLNLHSLACIAFDKVISSVQHTLFNCKYC